MKGERELSEEAANEKKEKERERRMRW